MRQAIRAFALGTLTFLSCFSLCAFAGQAPAELQPPANEHELFRVHAQGDQIYACTSSGGQFSWTLKAPDAQLYDKNGEPFGRHFAGPSWSANDGSQVTGKAAASVPSPDANSIPWLFVKAVSHSGDGVLARVTSIQRLQTKGGKAPSTGCDAAQGGQDLRVPYSADYVFFVPK
jgi:FtsP/CotA-like multicopper oxidase with cupredoxin domain